MIKINLENDKVLVFEDEKGNKTACISKPAIAANGDKIKIVFKVGTSVYEYRELYSDMEINGVVYAGITDTLAALYDLCAVFSAGGGDGSGVSLTDVDDAIDTHDTDETAHDYIQQRIDSLTPMGTELSGTTINITPVPLIYYEIKTPLQSVNTLNINIPFGNLLPSIVWFKTGATLPTIIFNGVGLLVTDTDLQPNKSYELSIINKRISIVEFNEL